jgi:23S rRNA (uracil1939-C5)-methyltransferase
MSFPLPEQKTRKLLQIAEGLRQKQLHFHEAQIEWLDVGPWHFRDRVDLTYDSGHYGFYDRDHTGIFSVEECPILSPALWELFQALKKIPLPIKKGSLRLRVTPKAAAEPGAWKQEIRENGIWLDFANDDVKALFEEKQTLHELMKLGLVEVGQRRKSLHWNGERFRLKEPSYHPWMATYFYPLGVLEPVQVPLQALVGSFSQTGLSAVRAIAKQLHHYLGLTHTPGSMQKWVEFGSGSGTLTFPLLGHASQVIACEFDEMAVEGLRQTLALELSQSLKLNEKIVLRTGDFQMNEKLDFSDIGGVLVNPPRSGLKKFLNPLLEIPSSQRPKHLIYMSCFLDSFLHDTDTLKTLGYELQKLSLLDQFPHTPHVELLTLWTRS